MKILAIILLSTIVFSLNAQSKVSGIYYQSFGSELEVKEDSSFLYKWRFDLSSSWTKGKWKINNDTIYFTKILVLDTLKYRPANGIGIDSLVLSLDENPESITNEEYISYQLTSGGQNRPSMPEKLFYRNDRLYSINKKGELIKKKVEGFGTKKMYVPWYIKKNKKTFAQPNLNVSLRPTASPVV